MERLRVMNKEIAIGYMVLKTIYVEKDAQGSNGIKGRIGQHKKNGTKKTESRFDKYIQAYGWLYFVPSKYADLHGAFETMMLLCFADLHVALMNHDKEENLANLIESNLNLANKMSVFAMLLELAHNARVHYA